MRTVMLTILALGTAAAVAVADVRFSREPNADRSGNDIRVEALPGAAGAERCEAMCAATAACVAYTYVKRSATVPAPLCRIKDQAPFAHESECCISGRRLP
jgi:hypothetical protein